ncbi:uncharacterized protein YlaI [Cytobacillus horneckiae]|uniref:DUF2197 domain-containing protein n=1 Tax=Cytobacillus horneckiae TaxID=549687 RepID=A0A2N0ZKD8_9BACI|nr:YlaI family protein [Cytobacillus horneckiae]NRG45497.1 YlaI family protein [Bacillus sp. CRN 9]MBN6889185.1 YlaI family protein [Cytobacillus horneckiae]MCM3178403.1 YlaI family protein [Cytobacillus horneckiae]MEC1156858.1 YlaI family protein [Cytobacillus horneckiae]MED2940457.1 YlaI family protein [Cytobacillus horneckiae]
MKVQCVICDTIETIENDSLEAKRLRNRPIHTYMCEVCKDRITKRTNERAETGNFKLYRSKVEEEEW